MRLDHIHLAKPIIKNSYLIFMNHSPLEGGRNARPSRYFTASGFSGLLTALGMLSGGATHRNSSLRLGRVASS